MATQHDVARSANVSRATVSRYINRKGYISPEIRKRIKEAIQELHYKPNIIAQSLKLKKSKTIGWICPNIAEPFFGQIAKVAEKVAQKSGYSVMVCNT